MKKALLLPLFLLIAGMAQGQQRKCYSAEYLKVLDAKQPGLEQYVKELPKQHFKASRAITFVPVVVHIVYKTTAQNLSDAYITAQLDQLNKCYARQNSDTNKLRAIFKPYAGATNIRFVLNQTIRVATTQAGFSMSTDGWGNLLADAVKHTSTGGSDAVTPDSKLNIWVCDLTNTGSGEVLGYAYPPAGLPNWGGGGGAPSQGDDGVVIDYKAFGGNNQKPLYFSSYGCIGKACVHEVGHYLGLRHTWGDDGGACYGQSGYEDDGISDTPVEGDANFGCDTTTLNSCVTANDKPDMIENYMDYSWESCMTLFTKEQVTFMQNVLTNIRTGVHAPTGVTDVEGEETIQLFPNPATSSLYLNLTGMDYNTVTLRLVDPTGRTVLTKQVQKSNTLIDVTDVSTMAKGMYHLLIESDQFHLHRNFIVQ